MPRVLIISHDVVGQRMAGPGIRYWELAHVLAAQQPVMLIAPQPVDRPSPTVTCGSFTLGDAASLRGWLQQADVIVANGFVLAAHPELARLPQPLALDLYDPVLLENLELHRHAAATQRAAQSRHDIAALAQQLTSADFILCATERQRDLYIGALMALGRLNPATIDDNARLRSLIDVLPFGLPAEPPVKQATALRGVVPGIAADDRVLLWTGGLWDWLDPLTLVAAMPALVARQPRARLVFLAGAHPGSIHPMRLPAETRAQAAALGLLDRHIFFYEQWFPYAQRADFLLEADIAVSLHRDHLETAYAAVRSRFLDHLWAGLPSVVSAGDAAAALVQEHDLGLVVPTGDPAALATALLALLDDDAQRRRCAENARTLAAAYTWERAAAPLIAFCGKPRRAADRSQASGVRSQESGESAAHQLQAQREQEAATEREQLARAQDTARNAALQALTSTRVLLERPLPRRPLPLGMLDVIRQALVKQLVRPFVVPLIEQQNAHNAAVLRALDALAENSDARRSEVYTALDRQQGQLDGHVARLEHLLSSAEQARKNAEQAIKEHLADLADADTLLAEQVAARTVDEGRKTQDARPGPKDGGQSQRTKRGRR